MIINVKKRQIIYGIKKKEYFSLSNRELRVLLLLSDNCMHSINDLLEFTHCNSANAIRLLISRLKKKIKCLEIKTYNQFGYKLKTLIFIEKENNYVSSRK